MRLRRVVNTLAIGVAMTIAATAKADVEAGASTSRADTLVTAESQEREGHILDALRTGQRVLERSIHADASADVEAARVVVNRLLAKIARVTFTLSPADARDVQVTFDGRQVPIGALSKKFSVDPGEHVVQANAEGADGGTLVFHRTITVASGELATIVIALEPGVPAPAMGVLACLQHSKSDEELDRCLPNRTKASQSGCQSCVVAANDGPTRCWCAIGLCVLAGAFFARRKSRSLR